MSPVGATNPVSEQRDFASLYLDNIKTVLDKHNRRTREDLRLNVMHIDEDDVITVAKLPVIGVEWDSHTEEALSLGRKARKYTLKMRANIWYYKEALTPQFKRREVMRAIGTISSIIRKNPRINGYCLDSTVLASTIHPRIRDGTVIAAGVVIIESEKRMRQDISL